MTALADRHRPRYRPRRAPCRAADRWTLWIKRGAGVILLGMAEYYFIQMGKVS